MTRWCSVCACVYPFSHGLPHVSTLRADITRHVAHTLAPPTTESDDELRLMRLRIGATVVTHSRYVIFQVAEVAVPKRLFRTILERIRRLRLPETVPR